MTFQPAHPIDGTQVVWNRAPFAMGARDIYQDVRQNRNETIAEIVESVPGIPWRRFQRFGRVILTDGEHEVEIPRANWARVRPRADRNITVVLQIPLQGGGGGSQGGGKKNMLGTLAAIALLAVVTLASSGLGAGVAGGWFAAGSMSAKFLAAGISIVGSLAIAALTPPPAATPPPDAASNQQQSGPASASGNVIGRGGVIPRPIGRPKMFPPFAQQPLVEIINGEEQVECILAVSGPVEWDDIRIAGAPLVASEDLQFETRQGWWSAFGPGIEDDAPLTLVTRQARQEQPQIELSSYIPDANDPALLKPDLLASQCIPVWHSVGTRNSPDEIWLDFAFPEGIYDSDTPDNYILLPLRFRMRLRGAPDWINLPELIAVGRKARRDRMLSVRLIWGERPAAIPPPPINKGFKYAYKSVQGQSVVPTTAAWAADAHFSAGSGLSLLSSDTFGSTNVRNVVLYEDRAELYLSEDVFPRGIYEIEVKRGAALSSSSFVPVSHTYNGDSRDVFYYQESAGGPALPANNENRTVTTILNRVASIWNEHPIAGPGLGLLALKGRARRLDQISAYIGGLVPDYDSGAGTWSNWTVPEHPVAAYRWMHCGPLNADPLPEELSNDADLVAWRSRCIARTYRCHTIADGASIGEIRQRLASTGFARPSQSEKWSVIEDRDRRSEGPRQVFTSRNTGAFRWEKAFVKMPHGFLCKFRNAEIDFEEDEVIVYADGYDATNATRIEEITYDGLVYRTEVVARAKFDLKQAELRMTFYFAETDIESLKVTRGDLCAVQFDTLSIKAGSARVLTSIIDEASGLTIGLDLDSEIRVNTVPDFDVFAIPDVFAVEDVFAQSWRSGVSVRLKNGSVLTREVYAETEEASTVFFKLPFFDPGTVLLSGEEIDILGRDCVVASGPLGSETSRFIVADIQPGENETASLVYVDEAPSLFPDGLNAQGIIQVVFTTSLRPHVPRYGEGSIAVEFSTSSAGIRAAYGADDIAIGVDTAAIAYADVVGTGVAAVEFATSADATLAARVGGAAAVEFATAGAAVAEVLAGGSAAIEFMTAGAGVRAAYGADAEEIAFGADAAGVRAAYGTDDIAVEFSPTATPIAEVHAAGSAAIVFATSGIATLHTSASGAAAVEFSVSAESDIIEAGSGFSSGFSSGFG